MSDKIGEIKEPGHIRSYFKMETWTLAIVAVTGIFYNIGMTAGPWFEGRLVQCLVNIMGGNASFRDMLVLALAYVCVIALVQTARYVKRLYVRKFANHVNRDMKHVLYRSLVHKSKPELEAEQVGAVMTKAISDVDTCVEGMRKFTTELFDTGVVMAAYLGMLLFYDWRLTLLAGIFPPVAYLIAEKLKTVVSRSAAAHKESAGRLNDATFDRVLNAVTYRVYGQEEHRDATYEISLKDYERKAVEANIWENTMQPVYQIISMMGVLFILWFGVQNVQGTGWNAWDVGAFTTFLSCFTKLAAKSSKAAKLFNAVQKAQVSWRRIQPFMQEIPEDTEIGAEPFAKLLVSELSFAYPGGKEIFGGLSFAAEPGEIIGVTGPVACGKSTLGKAFLCEYPYGGSIRFGGRELSAINEEERSGIIGYMGHQPELLNGSIEENILLGSEESAAEYLKAVCMEQEVAGMSKQSQRAAGNGGSGLSGGQQARIALARTLCHKRPVMILDDPFSAVDQDTEWEIMKKLREMAGDSIILLLSHRLTRFPELDRILWMDEGRVTVSDHARLMRENKKYAQMYKAQTKGGGWHEA